MAQRPDLDSHISSGPVIQRQMNKFAYPKCRIFKDI
jgi:hypothetical protein